MRTWDCESMRRDFKGDGMMAWNYDPSSRDGLPQWVRIGDDWRSQVRPHVEERRNGGEGISPGSLSFHWHPLIGGAGADEREPIGSKETNPRSIRKLQQAYKLPSFFDPASKLNVRFCEVRIPPFAQHQHSTFELRSVRPRARARA
eukprot:SAG22_NODE_12545_length_438_cov_1.070796_1_plen_145_part_11